MNDRFKTINEIEYVVTAFENATFSRDEWRHAEHLTVALYYLTNNDVETATAKMRSGIFKLLNAFGVDLDKEMPYHETLTVFWINTVETFYASRNGDPLIDIANQLIKTHDKDYPLRFYSRERLFSDEARKKYINSDF